MMAGVPCITTITGAAALEAIRALKTEGLDVRRCRTTTRGAAT